MTDFTLNAVVRSDLGKGASRRLRRLEGTTPAIVYGLGKAPVSITLEQRELLVKLENEAFYTHILELNVEGGEKEQVILKALQRHPYKPIVMHADFQRVDESCKVVVHVPIHFTNEANCKGVKTGGGVIQHHLSEVEVRALPSQLPAFITVDMTAMTKGQTVHLSDLKLPAGAEIVALTKGADHDTGVVSVVAPKGAAAEEASAE
ncbi:large subunit ribosomal protein L25 [Oceanospirillum multiglobuliferum]|uniref:Large ribosomal subunit protein bL25 n=1 Tax=Oceanospirillum multiglobuliferum TaxID=64969 RepID=A0A1T4LES8_9GAMM|nr:50S ribosomal protein L25/general stress protein Ctc [Oceanospirillum multiglobuliferum]OPX56689.1 50S ribosomal protein L25/general stress protein Ctc [Oceanospirillum multiglobuliferum]SJZ53121.1 large subunit ribosomal protein L25 [Oceanospirillum multiglobuliferum]